MMTKILDTNMMQGEVLITFDDGRMAAYSAALLYEVLPRAREIVDVNPDLDQDNPGSATANRNATLPE